MTRVLVRHVIALMPLIVALSGWVGAYRKRRSEPLCPSAFALLAFVTALAVVAAGSFVYFELRPEYLPAFESTQVRLFLWFLILGPACILIGFGTLGKEPKWLFWVLEVASVWMTALGLLAVYASWLSF